MNRRALFGLLAGLPLAPKMAKLVEPAEISPWPDDQWRSVTGTCPSDPHTTDIGHIVRGSAPSGSHWRWSSEGTKDGVWLSEYWPGRGMRPIFDCSICGSSDARCRHWPSEATET
jgi:hypothetical protein